MIRRGIIPFALALALAAGMASADTPPAPVLIWGGHGTGPSQFESPNGIATDVSGFIYVADEGNNRIQKFSSNGKFVLQWGTTGSGAGQFNHPTCVAVSQTGKVYVGDWMNHRIQQFTTSGQWVRTFGVDSIGNPTTYIGQPYALAVDAAGSVYETDLQNIRVTKWSADGNLITAFGSQGRVRASSPIHEASQSIRRASCTSWTHSLTPRSESNGLIRTATTFPHSGAQALGPGNFLTHPA